MFAVRNVHHLYPSLGEIRGLSALYREIEYIKIRGRFLLTRIFGVLAVFEEIPKNDGIEVKGGGHKQGGVLLGIWFRTSSQLHESKAQQG